MMTVRRVSECLGLSTATIYKLIDRGELAHVRVSNAIRIDADDLAAYLGRGR